MSGLPLADEKEGFFRMPRNQVRERHGFAFSSRQTYLWVEHYPSLGGVEEEGNSGLRQAC